MMKPFLQALDDRVLVCDGAMGTMLYAKAVSYTHLTLPTIYSV